MAMALGMQELDARREQGGVLRMDVWGGGVKCSHRGVEPSLSLVAASLSAVRSPLKQLPFHLDKLITESLRHPHLLHSNNARLRAGPQGAGKGREDSGQN